MTCHEFLGGTGTSSRVVNGEADTDGKEGSEKEFVRGKYTIAVLLPKQLRPQTRHAHRQRPYRQNCYSEKTRRAKRRPAKRARRNSRSLKEAASATAA